MPNGEPVGSPTATNSVNVGGSAARSVSIRTRTAASCADCPLTQLKGGFQTRFGSIRSMPVRTTRVGGQAFEDRVRDEPAVPRLSERDVGGDGVQRSPAIDDQDHQVGLSRGRDGAGPSGTVPRGLAVGPPCEAGHLDKLGVLEPIEERLVDTRCAAPGLDQGRVAPARLLERGDQARLPRIAGARDGNCQRPHFLLERVCRLDRVPGQPAILVGADDEPAAIELDQVGPEPVDVSAEEPP